MNLPADYLRRKPMARTSMHLAYYLFLLIFCIDEGDGRWKKADRENLQRDIKLYNKISERVEHDLQEYYAEYEDHGLLNFNVNRKYYETKRNILKSSAKLDSDNSREIKKESFLSKFTKIANNIPIYNQTLPEQSKSSYIKGKSIPRNKAIRQKSKWPKFEEILLAIGKKYDWKNDRWIKVKEKFKIKEKYVDELENSIMFHEKHRFSYKTIKLNRGKNKRNVVIAVTAIR